jgi:hypothetical protein
MSVELLPADRKASKGFEVRPNRCNCHPETCCCNDWAVYGPDGTKVRPTFFHEEDADEYAADQNELIELRRLAAEKRESTASDCSM